MAFSPIKEAFLHSPPYHNGILPLPRLLPRESKQAPSLEGRRWKGRPGCRQGSRHVLQAQAQASAAVNANDAQRRRKGSYNVVITGGSKGVGLALAKEFLRAGDSVVICSRDSDRVSSAVRELNALAKEVGGGTAAGTSCNMAKPADVASFASFARDKLGTIDIWINNAGTNAYRYKLLSESTDADLISIVETNVLGVMLGCKEAISLMKEQASGGHIFNMDGAGADGGATPRFAAYGATKRGLVQLSKSLQAELKMLGIANVGIHNLSPGMVTTELLMSGADTPVSKFFINCLAEEAGEVAKSLVPRIRRVPTDISLTGGVQGTYIRYLTKPKAYGQILGRLLLGQRKNRFVKEDSK